MADDTKLEIILEAIDKASGVLKEASDKIKASMGEVDNAQKSAKTSNEDLTTAVFKGTAAWDLLKEGISKATDFFKDSIGMAIEEERTLDLLNATMNAIGATSPQATAQMEAFGQSMAHMGIDATDAELAAAKLAKTAKGDLNTGIRMAKLASDLASSGFGTMEDNVDRLASVMAGRGQMAIRQYKLNISDTASTAEILDAIQKKVTMDTEQYANTIPGKIKVVQVAYDDLKKAIGKGFLDAVTDAINSTIDFNGELSKTQETAHFLKQTTFVLTEVMVGLFQFIKIGTDIVASLVLGFMALAEAYRRNFEGAKIAGEAFKESLKGIKGDVLSLDTTFDKLMNSQDAMNKIEAESANLFKATGDKAQEASFNVEDASKKSLASYEKQEDALKKLKEEYTKLVDSATKDLQELSDEWSNKSKSINDNIDKTKKNIEDLTNSYNRTRTSDTSSVAEQIVASENRIKDIKSQLAQATTDEERQRLQEELNAEQQNYDSSLAFRQANIEAIQAAQLRASKTDLERAIDDYNERRALADKEYKDKLADLDNQLLAYQTELEEEKKKYLLKTIAIMQYEIQATIAYKQQSEIRKQQTVDEVNASIAQYQRLAQAIASAKSASSSSSLQSTVFNNTKPYAMADGGIVTKPTFIMAGEAGAEAIIPLDKANGLGGQSIIVNITGGTYLSEEVAQDMGDMIIDKLKRILKL